MSGHRLLVAGIGNVFFGDDGFGVEVVRRLGARTQPDDVRVVDFGIRGFDLAYALLDGYDAAVLVDATPRGGAPGTLYVIEPGMATQPAVLGDTHGVEPREVLELVRAMDGRLPVLRIVGCEPAVVPEDGEMSMGLSAPVAGAIEGAVDLVESLVAELRGRPRHA